MKALGWSCFIAIVACIGLSPALAGSLHDFKGVPLETTIEDFRLTQHPDGYPAKVVCTGDDDAVMAGVGVYDSAEVAAGVKKCVWLDERDDLNGLLKGRVASLGAANSGYGFYDYSFQFVPDPKDGVLKFYLFDGATNRDAFPDTLSALTSKYGPPAITKDSVQNGIGNIFERTIAVWSSKLSSIVLIDRRGEVDKMGIRIKSIRLSEVVEKIEKEQKAAVKNPI